MNERRRAIIDGLRARGLNAMQAPRPSYGKVRDSLLARSKLSLHVQYNPNGDWGPLRLAHLVANRVPALSEAHPNAWSFIASCPYDGLVDAAEAIVRAPAAEREAMANEALLEFRKMPMELPQ